MKRIWKIMFMYIWTYNDSLFCTLKLTQQCNQLPFNNFFKKHLFFFQGMQFDTQLPFQMQGPVTDHEIFCCIPITTLLKRLSWLYLQAVRVCTLGEASTQSPGSHWRDASVIMSVSLWVRAPGTLKPMPGGSLIHEVSPRWSPRTALLPRSHLLLGSAGTVTHDEALDSQRKKSRCFFLESTIHVYCSVAWFNFIPCTHLSSLHSLQIGNSDTQPPHRAVGPFN